uniref:IFT81 calponin homology domain-containing protein n=1 Tax=Chromera velia CCMP2878 TaxID=1169474 RepID=A0A0G4GRA1_9ALVE|mmetsp:Transcript_54075/g.105808  ORF Transcript_54075/g.105808 Transcript_54075/m.105808 type:complete len:688 (-) Transcript_54075:145-2208(-)|eukprot:Cvel_23023.t1-p1 / transcript=Cvel_23023.t1 / gene=Cvel_23023 / organism=Chromera_velia_CCMP2878 / gene_product=Intraflagellar transport protein 81 homolog, putative / transcript_product=Intraflagellar transport protein 81 homolog, putative / location=Cvel_scaffold2325:13860-26964(+) / protein_length=687 / sequence_SO=supercontig / SO=protein_coding / is_pseudo=false
MASQLKEVVDHLNAPPFSMNLSLVSFDEKTGSELLEVLNTVLVALDSKQPDAAKLKDEDPEQMCHRVSDFLHVLGFKADFGPEFMQALAAGEKRTVHSILHWLLVNFEACEKRAYLAHFLVAVDVPEDYLRDEVMMKTYADYQELQAQFKMTHQHLQQQRQQNAPPTELKLEIAQLEAEKDQLQQRIHDLRQKTANTEGFPQLLEVTSNLRKEQEEEARLMDRIREQRAQVDAVEQQFLMANQRMMELKASVQEGDESGGAETMLKVLRDEAARNRASSERYQQEIVSKRMRIHNLQGILSEPPVLQQQLMEMEQRVVALRNEIRREEEEAEQRNQTDNRLQIYQNQAVLVGKKRGMCEKELKDLKEQKETLNAQLNEAETKFQKLRGHRHLRQEDFKKYATELREKTAKFKALKAQFTEMRSEKSILQRTEQVLQQRLASLADRVREAEKRLGIAGYEDDEKALEHISAEKASVDKEKGHTLEEMSRIVVEITAQLKEKKGKLAPQIKELRSLRDEYKSIEGTYHQRKTAYETTQMGLDTMLSKLREEVKKLHEEVTGNESEILASAERIKITNALLERSRRESRCLRSEEKHSKEFPTLSLLLQDKMSALEAQSKELRTAQRQVKENFDGMMRQKEMLVKLQRLMEAKLRSCTQEGQGMRGSGEIFRGDQVHHDEAGVNRLVIGD